ncbi:MAG: hypothetical protein AB7C98_02390 [Acidithiobacillus sp.]
MQVVITLSGHDAGLVNERDMALAIQAAEEVFAEYEVDPWACEVANKKQYSDVEITNEEALLCAIWEEANYAAWHKATIGWMSRDIDLFVMVQGATGEALNILSE